MTIVVVGAGYVGLVTAAGFAELGNEVVCVDIDERKIAALRRGELPIFEPGLDELVRRSSESERLSFVTDLRGAVRHARVVFLAVGTPSRSDGAADLSAVFDAAELIREHAGRELVLVLK